MDWNLEAPSWDLSEVNQANLPNMETMEGSDRYGMYRTKGEFSVDLKLGQVGNSGTESVLNKSKDAVGVSKMTSSSSGSSKRARAFSNGSQSVPCLVDGCHSDLRNCRDYHRRHKVCEVHSKTAQVTIGGHKQRFCQQCSRFHSLEEFDEGKRSCRKRLDGHNRRRRKPQPEPLKHSGSFLSNNQGTQTQLLAVYPSSTSSPVVNPNRGGIVASCTVRVHGHTQAHLADKKNLFLGSSPNEGKQLAFMQGEHNNHQSPRLPVASWGQAQAQDHVFFRTSLYSESSGLRCRMFYDSLTSSAHNSSGALSLLSTPQLDSHGNGLNQLVSPHWSRAQPLGLSLHDNRLESVDTVLGPNGSDHSSSAYNIRSQGNEAHLLFPFQWD